MLECMSVAAEPGSAVKAPRLSPKQVAAKIIGLVLLGILFGTGYDWAASRFYGSNQAAGFKMGVLHGTLMPAALPALLMGKDLPIYAPSNVGRFYNIGYIAGVNLCGTIFFGFAFWMPKQKPAQ
jgi:hypothetical protein